MSTNWYSIVINSSTYLDKENLMHKENCINYKTGTVHMISEELGDATFCGMPISSSNLVAVGNKMGVTCNSCIRAYVGKVKSCLKNKGVFV